MYGRRLPLGPLICLCLMTSCVSAPEVGPDAITDPDLSPDRAAVPDFAILDAVATESTEPSPPCISVSPQKVTLYGRRIGVVASLPVTITSCGEAPLTIHGITLSEDSSPDFTVQLVGTDWRPSPGSPLTISPGADRVVMIRYTPDEVPRFDGQGSPIPDTGTLRIETDAPNAVVDVELAGVGVEGCPCPVAEITCTEGNEVPPGTLLHLSGIWSCVAQGSSIGKYAWSVDQPQGSQSVFIPSNTFPSPTFEVNVAGTYTFHLMVYDEQNVPSCVAGTCEVVVITDEAIHVELLWHTPEDPDESDGDGADLDLHFTHPGADGWFDQPYNCSWFDMHPEWGSFDPSIDDNPNLHEDDADGAGPENINLNIPEDVTYKVGVHDWSDHGYGASYATVRVYIYAQLVFEVPDVKLVDGDLWEVCTVAWPSGNVQVVTDPNGSYDITGNYPKPQGLQK
ncbi:MAG: hypothetical protein ABIK09_12120 [Pseudomonadota bacterium]